MNRVGRVLYKLIGSVIRHLPGWRAERARVVLCSESGEVLLVKTWLSHQRWALPGGGVEKHETPEQAAVRELLEETGISVEVESLQYVSTVRSERLRANLVIFTGSIIKKDMPALHWPYNLEIIDRKWYSLDALPDLVSESTKHMIALAFNSKN
jgi:8-oxo-dGTP diphosphatase